MEENNTNVTPFKYLDLEGLKKVFNIVDNKIEDVRTSLTENVNTTYVSKDLYNTDKETFATKTEVSEVNDKVEAITVPTKVSDLTNDSNFATSGDVSTAISTAISDLIDGAPDTYDTLKEIADYIATHEDVKKSLEEGLAARVKTSDFNEYKETVSTNLDGKVDKIEGKSLSTYDFNDEYKEQLDNLSTDLDGKIDVSVYSSYTATTDTAISGKLDTTEFETYSGNVSNSIEVINNKFGDYSPSATVAAAIALKADKTELTNVNNKFSGYTTTTDLEANYSKKEDFAALTDDEIEAAATPTV